VHKNFVLKKIFSNLIQIATQHDLAIKSYHIKKFFFGASTLDDSPSNLPSKAL